MYKILVVAATAFEVQPLLAWLKDKGRQEGDYTYIVGAGSIEICITGIGTTATAWHLARRLQPDINLVINAGIAGALDKNLEIGQTVHVISEIFGDFGIEQADGAFADLFQSGLTDPNQPPFIQGKLVNLSVTKAQFLPAVHGVTVQKVHGFEPSIEKMRALYPGAQVETMEGAAVFYGCLLAGVPFFEIRAISNYVEKRDRSKWDIPGAINALNFTLLEMIDVLCFPAGESKR